MTYELKTEVRHFYETLRAFRALRAVVFFKHMGHILCYYPRKRQIISCLLGLSKVILAIHILGLIWLLVLCQPGNQFPSLFLCCFTPFETYVLLCEVNTSFCTYFFAET